MKYSNKIFCTLLFCLLSIHFAKAQKNVNPHFEAHRLDFRDIGYPAATMIPADDSPIASLLAHSNGKVYGATSGKQSYLFVYDHYTNKVYPLGKIPSAVGVHNALTEGANGEIYIGTGLNELTKVPFSKEMPYGRRAIEDQMWVDIKAKYEGYAGGKIFMYDPKTADKEVYLPEDEAKVTDLGVAVKGNSIYTMTINQEKTKIYGITYPEAQFFEYDIAAKSFKNHGQWLTTMSHSGPERSWRSVPRSLVPLPNGSVISSGDGGLMTYFEPSEGKVKTMEMRIPGEYWITQKYEGYPVVEQLILSEDSSTLYGSSSDGFLFRVDLKSNQLYTLGKPMVERRVRAMTLGKDKQLYMICGEKTHVCRMFTYDLSEKNNGFKDMGVLGVDRSPYYAKIGYQFDAMCTANDGTIFIGESDRRAKLFFYVPGGSVFPAVLNPTNPK